MQRTIAARPPLQLWVVGGLSLLWNAFGCYDYVMTRTENAAYFKSMMPGVDPGTVFAWVDAFPIWAQVGWGLGPWCALAGSLLLLLRNRFAVHAFVLSLVGMALSFGYQLFLAEPMPGVTRAQSAVMPIVITIVGILLLWYASAMRRKGVLR